MTISEMFKAMKGEIKIPNISLEFQKEGTESIGRICKNDWEFSRTGEKQESTETVNRINTENEERKEKKELHICILDNEMAEHKRQREKLKKQAKNTFSK